MRAEIHDERGYVNSIEGTPVCGEDFCDNCGDCLHCYGGDESCPRGAHRWVIYADEPEGRARIAALLPPTPEG